MDAENVEYIYAYFHINITYKYFNVYAFLLMLALD